MKTAPEAIVSLHDVMPETLPQVREVLAFLRAHRVPPITLLVVPGRAWSSEGLAELREWSASGHRLAAHGWHHVCQTPTTLHHRLHAALLSRTVAEHLSLDEASILSLMRRSAAWFSTNGLPSPRLYVPPAWALGRVRPGLLGTLAFAWVESTRGMRHIASGRRIHLPLVGFEADTALRAMLLTGWNRSQIALARLTDRPLRISIHPHDLQLRLADALKGLLARQWTFIHEPGEARCLRST